MAIFTSPNLDEILPGSGVTPAWFIHRYKAEMNNFEAAVAEMGTAADHGYDPAIDTIPFATVSTTGVCNFPTHKEWSAGQTAMLFHFKTDHNTADNMTVDVSWYEGCYGSTGTIERWRFIATDYGITDDDTRQIGTDGGRILCHIDAIHNPDGDAHLTVYARGASAVQIVGMGGGEAGGTIIDEGVEAIGAKVWDSTLTPPRWVKCDITTILAAVADLDDAIEDHDAVLVHPDTVKVGGMARTTLVGAAVAAGDVCRITTSVNGGVLAAGYDAAGFTTRDLPISASDAAVGVIGLPVVARVDTTIPVAVHDGDAVIPWATPEGALVVGGYDAANTTPRNLPIVTNDSAAGTTGLPIMARADSTIPVAVADGDAVNPWASTTGALVVAGYDAANVFPRPLPVEAHNAINQGVGVPVVGRAEDTAPVAVADGDTVFPWISTTGVQVVGGYDATGAVSRVLPVEASGAVSSATGVPVGGVADSTIPAAVHDTDFVPQWMTLNGAQVVAGYSSNSTAAMLLPVEQNSTASSGTGIPVGGLCESTIPAARADGNFSALWMDLYGAAVVAGYDVNGTMARPIPVNTDNETASVTGIPIGGRVDTTIPADHADAEFAQAWMSKEGAQVGAGYDTANTIAKPIPIATEGTGAGTVGAVHVLRAETTTPAAQDDGDAVVPWATPTGAQVVAGYDASATFARPIPVEATDGVSQNIGVPVGAKAYAGIPAAVADADFTLLTTDLTGSQRAHLTQGLDYTTSSVETREKPGTGINEGTIQVSNAAATAIVAASTACIEVTVQNLVGNSPIAVGGSTITSASIDGVVLQGGQSITLPIDDLQKVYGWATVLNERLNFTYITR